MPRPPPSSTLFPYTTLFRSIFESFTRFVRFFLLNQVQAQQQIRLRILGGKRGQPAINSLGLLEIDRKSTRLNSSHVKISYAVFCLKKKKNKRSEQGQADAEA